jgi:hypothetical protein
MTNQDELKNLISFLICIFGETSFISVIMKASPDYLLEKWSAFEQNHPIMLHEILIRELYEPYCKQWGIE